MLKFFYQSGTMNFFGQGYLWHKLFNFPKFDIVTKTVTLEPKIGNPCKIIVDPLFTKSTWNKVGLDNKGFLSIYEFLMKIKDSNKDLIISIAGNDEEILRMVYYLNKLNNIKGIELNYSCPNVTSYHNKIIPITQHNLYLKLNHTQNPFDFDLRNVNGIRLNSVPMFNGGVSGKLAVGYNWSFIEKYKSDLLLNNISLAGSSWTSLEDIECLKRMGIKEFGIGSVILLNPRLVENLR